MPWLPEAHERVTPEQPRPAGRIRNWWRRFLHPHGHRLHPLLLCPFCDTLTPDPTDNCPRCGL